MKDIKGYEGLYAVTEDGRVWVYGRFLSAGKSSGGRYPGIVLAKDGVRFSTRIHRLVAEAYLPNPKNKPFVNHKNGIKNDNRVENLEWCTNAENVLHAWKTGLRKPQRGLRGESNPKARLKWEEVKKIRELRKAGKTLHQLGDIFGVSFRTIWDITTNRHWVE